MKWFRRERLRAPKRLDERVDEMDPPNPEVIYGCALPLDEARKSVVSQTGIALEPRDSSFYGGQYWLRVLPSGELKVRSNKEALEGDEEGFVESLPLSWSLALVSVPDVVLSAPWQRIDT